MDKNIKKQMREEAELEEDVYDSSGGSIDKDYETLAARREMGDFIPDDVFKYKYLRIVPTAADEFAGIVDKDSVLANIGGQRPNLDEIALVNQTIVLIKKIFVVEQEFAIPNEEGEPIIDIVRDEVTGNLVKRPRIVTMKVFDKSFQPLVDGFSVYNKTLQVSSRAMGDDREAILDRTTHLQKGIKKNDNKQKNVFGMGA